MNYLDLIESISNRIHGDDDPSVTVWFTNNTFACSCGQNSDDMTTGWYKEHMTPNLRVESPLDANIPVCAYCNRTPNEIQEYQPEQTGEDMSPVDYVLINEGTLNHVNNHFACTDCYIKIGMPSSPTGWKAP